MKVVFFGSDRIGLPTLEALAGAFRVRAVVTGPDRPRGRGLPCLPTPIKEWAVRRDIEVLQFERLDGEAAQRVARCVPDLCIVFSYGLIIPESVIRIPSLAFLNIHPSLLPKYRGAAPMEWALINGETESGITVATVVKEVDAGDVYCAERYAISTDETIITLREKVAAAAPRLAMDAIAAVIDGRKPQPQTGTPTYARKLTKSDGRISWALAATAIHNLCRGVLIWPGATTFVRTHKGRKSLKLLATSVEVADGVHGRPGEVVGTGSCVRVACGQGILRIERLQMEGKTALPADVFLRGTPIPEGTILNGA